MFQTMKTAGNPPLTPPLGQDIAGRQVLARHASRDLAVVAALVLLGAIALGTWLGLGTRYPVKAMLVYSTGAWLVWRSLGNHPHSRFGPANQVTLIRLGSVALMAALLGEPLPGEPLSSAPAAAWWLVIAALVTALMDAVDGWLARRSGLASAFGALFDLETDAALTLVLCALVVQAGQVGIWILASGAMRYAFVLAALALPWLGGPLPPNKRRQTVCVVQITTLIVCLVPVLPPLQAGALAAISLAMLTLSFTVDVQTLARQRPTPPET
jgi:phosphatidylglycerophosphate synthase